MIRFWFVIIVLRWMNLTLPSYLPESDLLQRHYFYLANRRHIWMVHRNQFPLELQESGITHNTVTLDNRNSES